MLAEQSLNATILSDSSGTILYASPHLDDFLGQESAAGLGTPFTTFLQGLQRDFTRWRAHESHLEQGAGSLTKKMSHMHQYTRLEHRAVLDGEVPAGVGVALLPALVSGGDAISLKVVMARLELPGGGVGCLTLFYNATEQLSVEHVLNIACTGEYLKELRAEKEVVRSPFFVNFVQRIGKAAISMSCIRLAASNYGSDGSSSDASFNLNFAREATPFHLNAAREAAANQDVEGTDAACGQAKLRRLFPSPAAQGKEAEVEQAADQHMRLQDIEPVLCSEWE